MIPIFFKKNSALLLSISIFLVVFILIGIPFTNWWCDGNDAFLGLYYGYQAKTWKDLIYFFCDGNVNPSSLNNPTFFSVFYRPITRIVLGLEYWAFGINIYYYFLTDAVFHAINTTLLFNIFLFFTGNIPALLGALFFAFHPLIGYKFGVLGNIQYYINTTLILLTLMFLKKYIDSNKIYFYLLSIFLFIISIFSRETGLILPVIIFLGTYLYKSIDKEISIRTFFTQFKDNLKITAPYVISVILYLILRACLYPMNSSGFNAAFVSNKNFNIIQKIAELKIFIYDALALTWLPFNHTILRGFIIIFMLFFLLWLFMNNSKKLLVLCASLFTFMMLWPAFIENYCARYFYEAYPFVLLSLILLFQYYQGNLLRFKKMAFVALSLECAFLVNFSLECLSTREKNLAIYANAVQDLVKNPKMKNCDSIFVLITPAPALEFYMSNLLWTLLDNPSIKIQIDGSNLHYWNCYKTNPWTTTINNYDYEGDIEVTKLNNGFRLKSLSTNIPIFAIPPVQSMLPKNKIINKIEDINGHDVVTDFTILVDKKNLTEKTVFLFWDLKSRKYIVL